ncbi:MAG: hypothetical protein GF388_08060 [Candidatus Aegiribacteria sp.]|nr:hypothetical protein [Candidatus Aegiribacteria sp.]
MTKLFLILLVAIVLTSCGLKERPALPVIDSLLVITDTIGVEMYDEDGIIGLITGLSFMPNGNIAVLDQKLDCISIFTNNGQFIESIGGEGEGPGYFTRPSGFGVFDDGSFVVSDRTGVSWFDSTHNCTEKIIPEYTVLVLDACNDGTFFGNDLTMQIEDGEGMFVSSYGRWDSDLEQIVSYYETRLPASSVIPPEDGIQHERDITHYCISSISGNAFISNKTREDLIITGYDPDGNEFLRIEDEDYYPVRRTDSEIQQITERRESIERLVFGSDVAAFFDYIPDEYKPAIINMFVDHEERLWIRLGYYNEMVFRIYDMDGNILFHAMLNAECENEDYLTWKVTGDEHGFLAYDANPVDEIVIYVLQLVENSSENLR